MSSRQSWYAVLLSSVQCTPNNMHPRVAIIYLCHGNLRHLPEVVASWASLSYPKDRVVIYAVPAASPDGIADVIRRDVLPRSGKDLPEIVLFNDGRNEGFAKNNNAPMRAALARGVEYIYLQNGDLKLDADAITESVALAESDRTIGSVQSLVLFWNDAQKVNTDGCMIHVAGYGYARDNGKQLADITVTDGEEIPYASGAAVLYRADVLQKVGLLEEGFFMYHEDLELGLRIRLAGYVNRIALRSKGYHDYQFSRNPKKFAWMELYRWVVMLGYYKFLTLLLLAPLLLAIEVGSGLLSIRGAGVSSKLYAYREALRPATWRLIADIRRRTARLRVVGDRELLRLFTGKIEAQETSGGVMTLVNTVIEGVWRVAYRCIVW